jgi:hypothetical protein
VNPLMEPFLYETVVEHQDALRASAHASAPDATTRALCVDFGRVAREEHTPPCLWRLLTAAR